jgi:Cu-Zn family superoxide dismutase
MGDILQFHPSSLCIVQPVFARLGVVCRGRMVGRNFAKPFRIMKLAFVSLAGLGALLLAGCSTSTESSSSSSSSHAASSKKSEAKAGRSATDPAGLVARAVLSPASGSSVQGMVNFIKDNDQIRVDAHISGLTPGKHGFHIHEKGDCSAPDASSAGGHFNPTAMPHAGPEDHSRHVGDFGNLEADASGSAHYSRSFAELKLDGDASILGKAVIVHAKADDLKTQPSGDAGGRVACGVIEKKSN